MLETEVQKHQARYGRKTAGSDDAKAAADKKTADEAAAKAKADADAKAKADADSKEMSRDEVSELVTKAVTAALKAEMPKQENQVTEAGIKALIQAEFAKQKTDSKTISKDDVAGLIGNVLKEQMDSMRKDKKFVQGGDQGGRGGKTSGLDLEYPNSLTKGNLPLHMKQLMNCLLRKHQNDGIDAADIELGKKHEDHLVTGMKMVGAKALTSTGTGTGAEWVPRNLSSELNRRLFLESQIAQSFMAQEIDMPTDPYDMGLITTNPLFKLTSVQGKDAAPTGAGTALSTLQTVKQTALVQYSYEADEDSIIPILPTLQQKLGEAAARALENAILNGDTTGTHQDSDVTDPDDQARAWKGLRKLALAASLKVDFSTGGLTRSNLLSLVKMMGKWGANSKNIVWVVGTNGSATLMNLDEVALYINRGSTGTWLAGGPAPAPWGGVLTVSEMARENLNASGVYDGVTTTKGTVIAFNKTGFLFGSRRQFTIEVDRNIRAQTNDIVASFRKAFAPVEVPSATIKTVALGYNYTA